MSRKCPRNKKTQQRRLKRHPVIELDVNSGNKKFTVVHADPSGLETEVKVGEAQQTSYQESGCHRTKLSKNGISTVIKLGTLKKKEYSL